jgi:hypothetical protein
MNKCTTQGKVAICSIFLTPERKFSCIFLNDAVNTVGRGATSITFCYMDATGIWKTPHIHILTRTKHPTHSYINASNC